MVTAPEIAVSTVIFALRPDGASRPALSLPLVVRTRDPYDGRWALPGGPLGEESLEDAARRTLAATTGLAPAYLEQMYTFGDPDRSPDGRRVVSVVYWALVRADEVSRATPQQNVRWLPADDLPPLAFDHNAGDVSGDGATDSFDGTDFTWHAASPSGSDENSGSANPSPQGHGYGY